MENRALRRVGGGAAVALTVALASCSSSYNAQSCVADLEPGWSVVEAADGTSAVCRANEAQVDLVADPVAASDACSCDCASSQSDGPSCGKGTVMFLTGSTDCTDASVPYVFDGTGGCIARPGGASNIAGVGQATPLAPYAGACTASVVVHADKITSTPFRVCAPAAADAEPTCRGEVAFGFSSCIAHAGDLPCPSGPFSHRRVAVDRATIACDGGCTACANFVTCGPATFRVYNDSTCATEVASRVIDGKCNGVATGTPNAPFTHARYDAEMHASCTGSPAPTTTVHTEGARTVCCR